MLLSRALYFAENPPYNPGNGGKPNEESSVTGDGSGASSKQADVITFLTALAALVFLRAAK